MSKRTKNRLKLHRLWDENPTQFFFGTFADDDSGDGSEGGGGDGGEGGSEGGEGGSEGGEGGEGGEGEGNKSKPTDAEAKLLKEVMDKKKKLDKATKELKEAQELVKQVQALGGLDKLSTLIKAQKDAETAQLEAKGEWERLKARMAEENATAVAAKDAEIASERQRNAALQAQIEELTVGTAFTGSKFLTEETIYTPTKARIIYGAHFDIVDGKVVGYDKPRGASERTPLVDGSGTPLSFEAAIKKIVDADPDKNEILRAKAKPGAGSDSRPNGKAGGKPNNSDMSGVDRIAAGLAKLK